MADYLYKDEFLKSAGFSADGGPRFKLWELPLDDRASTITLTTKEGGVARGINEVQPLGLPLKSAGAVTGSTNGTTYTPADPLVASAWHFPMMGDIETIWEDFTGTGVAVGVWDDGLQYTHPDLDDNYDASLEVTVGGSTVDPLPTSSDPHGTSVAGLIAAEEGNGLGSVGVAYDASLTGINIFSGLADINNNFAGFLEALDQMENFDLANHSWGSTPSFNPNFVAGDKLVTAEYYEALTNGRGGLGTLQFQAAGNDGLNADGDYTNVARETITVAAHDSDGDISWYSNHGASILVSAPTSGDGGVGNLRQVTTDLVGTDGYSSTDYTNTSNGFGGTSGATPVTAGVGALMLEANPGLGWRDAHNILAYSSHELGNGVGGGASGTDENHEWFYNAADNWNGGGLHFSEDYGYGGVNAYNAVRMAEVWTLFDSAQTSANEDIMTENFAAAFDLPDLVDENYEFTVTGDIEIEYLSVTIDLTHSYLGDMTIDLISPDGTEVRLMTTDDADGGAATTGWIWEFGIEALRGEMTAGTWGLHFKDNYNVDDGILDNVTFTAYGRDDASAGVNLDDDVYHYTDEFSLALADDAGRMTVVDTTGTDWFNLAAMTGDLDVDLNSNRYSTSNGTNFVRTGSTTVIENAVGGDGDDEFTGNSSANEIYGMRGNDMIEGLDGNDSLFGGAGDDILNGGVGADALDGGAGSNTASYEDATTRMIADLQNSAINFGEAVGDTFTDIQNLIGGRYNDQLRGNASDNSFDGGNFSDRLYGRAGDDTLNGQVGSDAIYGNSGADVMTGEHGNDRFIYFQLSDTQVGAGNRDIITDFDDVGSDRMEISRFDADTTTGGNQVFNFVGTAAFSNSAGELRYEQDAGNGWTVVQGDVNGDSIADFEIELTGLVTLAASDFLL